MRHLFPSLHPLGLLSPLNPRNPLNPLRPLLIRQRPPRPLPADHRSVLADFYGQAVPLDSVPYPNQEWTRCMLEFKAEDGRRLVALIEVRVLSVPTFGWLAVGNLALWDFVTGDYFQTQRLGELDFGPSHRFAAPGWWLERKPGLFNVYIDEPDARIKLNLSVRTGPTLAFGDPDLPAGFSNLNRRGLLPLWMSYRAERGHIVMNGKLEWNTQKIAMMADAGRAHVTHQSFHMSARDWRCFSPAAAAEAAILRPNWRLYDAAFDVDVDDKGARRSLCLTLLDVRNGHTDARLRRTGFLYDEQGRVAPIQVERVHATNERVFGRLAVAQDTEITFKLQPEARSSKVSLEAGTYTLAMRCDLDYEGATHMPPAGPLRYEARRTPSEVSGHWQQLSTSKRRSGSLLGTGTLEVFDLVTGLGVK